MRYEAQCGEQCQQVQRTTAPTPAAVKGVAVTAVTTIARRHYNVVVGDGDRG
jgi:hypothetical protein